MEKIGRKHINENLEAVLNEAWRGGFSTKSDFARAYADFVAMAASLNWITTRIMVDVFGRDWQCTSKGLAALNEIYGIDTDVEEPR